MTTQRHLNKSQTVDATGASLTAGCREDESPPKVVFLPFSESLMKNPRQHTPCWQRPQELASTSLTNYPADQKTNQANDLILVPFDREYMSLSVLRHGRWESLNQ
jgi:hypothetical protein